MVNEVPLLGVIIYSYIYSWILSVIEQTIKYPYMDREIGFHIMSIIVFLWTLWDYFYFLFMAVFLQTICSHFFFLFVYIVVLHGY